MATKYENITGELWWAMIHPDNPDEYRGNKNWVINLVLDEANLDKYNKLALMGQVREIDGRPAVRFKRPITKTYNGEVTEFLPPAVLQWSKEENKFVPFDDLNYDDKRALGIGNGSLVKVNLTTYSTVNGNGARFNDIVMLEHIPFVPVSQEDQQAVGSKPEEKEDATEGPKPW